MGKPETMRLYARDTKGQILACERGTKDKAIEVRINHDQPEGTLHHVRETDGPFYMPIYPDHIIAQWPPWRDK